MMQRFVVGEKYFTDAMPGMQGWNLFEALLRERNGRTGQGHPHCFPSDVAKVRHDAVPESVVDLLSIQRTPWLCITRWTSGRWVDKFDEDSAVLVSRTWR